MYYVPEIVADSGVKFGTKNSEFWLVPVSLSPTIGRVVVPVWTSGAMQGAYI